MKMCLAPCYQGCTDERYAEEAKAVEHFLTTRGNSRLVTLRSQRDEASANLEFESAAALHAQLQRVEAVRTLAPELVRPLSQLRAVILQTSALPGEIAVFLFEDGRLSGPAAFSTLGMRIQNERSGSTSLFAQPMAIEAIPEAPYAEAVVAAAPDSEISPDAASTVTESPISAKLARGALEARLEAVLATLANQIQTPSPTHRQGHLALLKRWYYRPEVRREGEIFFPGAEGQWPVKAILRGIGRVAAGSFKPQTSGS
jgi:excinuclease UvrABC nuclease subunit